MPATDERLTELEQRREANVGTQVDNASLHAGSPMYYYCHTCGTQTAVKDEGWYRTPPPRHCDPCKDLIHDGVIRDTDTYDDWLKGHGHPIVPR